MNEELQVSPTETIATLSSGIKLQIVDPETAPEVFALVQKNLHRLKPYVSWADEVYTQEDRFKGFMFQLDQYHAGTAFPTTGWDGDKPMGMFDIRELDSSDGPEVGYWIDQDYEGKGIAAEAVQTLIDFARDQTPFTQVRLTTMADNSGSVTLAERLGFKLVDSTQLEEGPFAGRTENHYVKDYEPQQVS